MFHVTKGHATTILTHTKPKFLFLGRTTDIKEEIDDYLENTVSSKKKKKEPMMGKMAADEEEEKISVMRWVKLKCAVYIPA